MMEINTRYSEKVKDLERKHDFYENKLKIYEEEMANMDAKLTEQNNVINQNIEVIQSQQKDIDQLNDELDALVNKVALLTDDNKRFYEENLSQSLQIKSLKLTIKESQSNDLASAQLRQVPEFFADDN